MEILLPFQVPIPIYSSAVISGETGLITLLIGIATGIQPPAFSTNHAYAGGKRALGSCLIWLTGVNMTIKNVEGVR